MKIIKQSKKNIKEIITALENGAVLVCPTDTVYGFLADASNKNAVNKIFEIKKRDKSKPLPVFVKDLEMAKKLAKISEAQEKNIKKHWPGKFTFVLQRKKDVQLYGVGEDTIALRIPKYKFLNDLLEKINKPLVQTSANISGSPATTKIGDILEQFSGDDVIIIDAGDLPKSKPSTIIDLTKDIIEVIRK